jgi:hypothetical protein
MWYLRLDLHRHQRNKTLEGIGTANNCGLIGFGSHITIIALSRKKVNPVCKAKFIEVLLSSHSVYLHDK